MRVKAKHDFDQRALKLTQRYADDESAPQCTLSKRMSKHVDEQFVFVGFPFVPSDNNISERALRALVVARKMSGGTRSAKGTQSAMTLFSLFGTWNLRGENPLTSCQKLLAAHPP